MHLKSDQTVEDCFEQAHRFHLLLTSKFIIDEKTATKLFPILVSVYGLLYMGSFVIPLFWDKEMIAGAEEISVLSMFLFYLVGLGISWFNERLGGILIQLWYFGIWVLCFFFWPGSGMIPILAFPGWVLGILMQLSGFKASRKPKPSGRLQWKYLLRVLLINYSVLYLVPVIHDLTDNKPLDYFTMPFLLYPVLFLVFATAFAFSWKKELIAGFLLLLWYGILLFGTVAYTIFLHQGPWIFAGVVIVVQGIFYLYFHYRYQRSNTLPEGT